MTMKKIVTGILVLGDGRPLRPGEPADRFLSSEDGMSAEASVRTVPGTGCPASAVVWT
jgi:hypothetical protein